MSLTQIEGDDWGEPPEDATPMVEEVHRLRHVPLGELTTEDYRMLLLQRVSLGIMIPRALTVLERDPRMEGDMFEGDVLSSLLITNPEHWRAHPDQQARVEPIVAKFGELDPEDPGHDYLRDALAWYRENRP